MEELNLDQYQIGLKNVPSAAVLPYDSDSGGGVIVVRRIISRDLIIRPIRGDIKMNNKSLYNSIGCMKLEDLESFIAGHGWECQHCDSHDFAIEQYADTGWCAVSATPYVKYKEKKERFSECGAGFPEYTIQCSKCFATTRYNAVKIAEAIEAESKNWPAPKIVEAS